MSRFSLFRRRKQETAAPESSYSDSGSFSPGKTAKKKPGAPSEVDDPILPEKKRARRRLVGAVTITLAAIIVLPMIFDSEPQIVSQDILIDIPSRDKPSQTAAKDQAKKKVEEVPVVLASSDKPSGEQAAAISDKKEQAKTAETPTKEVGKTENTKEKPAASESKADTKSEVKAETKTADSKKPEDPIGQLIAKNTSTKADAQEKFVIQVAAVSSQDKANELQGTLQKAGLNSYTQKVALKDGGERIRVRIGPLPSKKEVNSTCAKLSQLKLPCTLIN